MVAVMPVPPVMVTLQPLDFLKVSTDRFLKDAVWTSMICAHTFQVTM
jgi:hypothetical protein